MQNPHLIDHLKTRRTVPSINLKDPAPSEAEVLQMLEMAARVPDHGKLAPWRFIRYENSDCATIGQYLSRLWKAENDDASEERLELETIRFSRAPLVVGIVSSPKIPHKIPVFEQELSAGAVCLNLIHAAYAFGFIGQWLTEWYSYHPAASRYLGAEDGERFAGFIHIGTPSISPTERPRPDLTEITSYWSPAQS